MERLSNRISLLRGHMTEKKYQVRLCSSLCKCRYVRESDSIHRPWWPSIREKTHWLLGLVMVLPGGGLEGEPAVVTRPVFTM